MDYVSNEPNAAKLINSLRNTGYSSYAAIEDIIDNSVDAQAKMIKVFIQSEGKDHRVIIADNGVGMNAHVLDQALRLGSLTEKDEVSDLGKYGMGLCTASISMARRLEVFTRQKGAALLYEAQDLDHIAATNKFDKERRSPNVEEEKMFQKYAGEHGTVVVLSKVDRLSDPNVSQFSAKLTRDLGRIYRKFVESETKIFVNDKEVPANDPMWLNDPKTTVYSDEEYDLPTSIAGGKKEKIHVKIVLLPEMTDELMKENKINIQSQGFYVMRNNREIENGSSLGIFHKHGDFNRMRIELSFSASLDAEMGVKFSKDGVEPKQGISDFLKQELGGQITSIRTLVKKTQKSDPNAAVDHADSEAVIAKKVKLLIVPEAEVEKRGPRTKSGTNRTPKDGEATTRIPRETKLSPKGLGASFETASMGRDGALYECYQEGKVIVIRWNSDHPFYDQVVFPNRDKRGIVSALDYFVFALASAELKVSNDENVRLLETIKGIVSSNLRALLS